MTRFLKNITGSDVQMDDVGEIIVPAGSQLELDPLHYLKWARSDDVVTFLTSGDLVLEDDGVDLSSSEGVRLIQKLFNLKVSEDTILAGQSIKELNLIGDYSLVIADGVATINFAPSANNGTGAVLQSLFVDDGAGSNLWLKTLDASLRGSDRIMYVVPYACKLTGITFSNREKSADCNIEIYKSLKNNDDNKSLVYTMEVRNSRLALKTNILDGPMFEAGDKISVYQDDKGTHPNDPAVAVYLRIRDLIGTENSESFDVM